MRRIRFNRWGLAEDPRGYFVCYQQGGRTVLREVVETYRREVPLAIMLRVRSFNREIVEDVAASFVHVINEEGE